MNNKPERFYGNYRGIVVDREDPMDAGRVRVHVYGIHDGVEDDQLPWAQYADSFMGGQQDIGGIIVPNVGSMVWVFFEAGSHDSPVYWAGAPAMVDKNTPHIPQEAQGVPDNKVFKTASGITVEMDDTEDTVRFRFYHPSGYENVIDNDGNITNTTPGNSTETIQGDTTKDTTGSVTHSSGDDFTADAGGAVTINAGGDVNIAAGGSTITIANGGDVTISAGGNVVVSGAMVMLN